MSLVLPPTLTVPVMFWTFGPMCATSLRVDGREQAHDDEHDEERRRTHSATRLRRSRRHARRIRTNAGRQTLALAELGRTEAGLSEISVVIDMA